MKHHNNRSANQTFKRHTQKINKILFEWIILNRSSFYSVNFRTRVNLLLTVNWLVWTIMVFICSVYPTQNVYFLQQYHQNITVKYACTETFISIKFLFHLMKPSLTLPQILTQVNKHLPHHQSYIRGLTQSYSHHLVFNNEKIVMSEFKTGTKN